MSDKDLIVVGGGLAGSAGATLLAPILSSTALPEPARSHASEGSLA